MKIITLNLFALLILSACNSDDPAPTPTPAPAPTPTPSGTHFLKATVDSYLWDSHEGVNGCCSAKSNGANVNSTNNTVIASFGSSFIQNPSYGTITSTIVGNLEVDFSRNQFTFAEFYESNTKFNNCFAVGTHIISSSSSTSNTPSVEIIYYDSESSGGDEWHSSLGDQTESTCSVTSSVSSVNGLGEPLQTVVGTFSCKVYSLNDPTISKTITGGSFNMVFTKQ